MEPMEFAELSRKVIALYLEGSHQEALQFVHEGRERFPDEDSTLTWYEACLLGVTAEPDKALEVLEGGLERGLGWHPRMLRDPDLDSVRTMDGWEAFETRSTARVAGWDLPRPPPLIRSALNPAGTLIVLHGAGNDPDQFFEEWEAATPGDWSVVAPVGEVPMWKVEWAWPFDLETDSLVESLEGLSLIEPVVLSGFSQGGRLAAKAAWDGDIGAAGLVLFATNLTPQLWGESKQCPVPSYVVAGTKDAYEETLATSAALHEAGIPIHLDVREGLGHMRPDDLDRTLAIALDWIVTQV